MKHHKGGVDEASLTQWTARAISKDMKMELFSVCATLPQALAKVSSVTVCNRRGGPSLPLILALYAFTHKTCRG